MEIECQVEPKTVEVQWFFNDKQIDEKDSVKKIVKHGNSRSIKIEKFAKSDQGTYFVKLVPTDEFYSAEPLRIAQLIGVEKNDFGMNDVKCKRGETASIECKLDRDKQANEM